MYWARWRRSRYRARLVTEHSTKALNLPEPPLIAALTKAGVTADDLDEARTRAREWLTVLNQYQRILINVTTRGEI
jgi:hypothetical protein